MQMQSEGTGRLNGPIRDSGGAGSQATSTANGITRASPDNIDARQLCILKSSLLVRLDAGRQSGTNAGSSRNRIGLIGSNKPVPSSPVRAIPVSIPARPYSSTHADMQVQRSPDRTPVGRPSQSY